MKQLSPTSAFRLYTSLCIIGALVSLYLLIHHLEHRLGISSGRSFCSINELFDCDKVAASPYSEPLGFPVAGFGLFFFAANLFILKFLKDNAGDAKTWTLLKFLSLLGVIPIVILASISIIIIQSICIFCFLTYLCAIGLAAIAFRLELAERNFISEGSKQLLDLIKNHQSLIAGFLILAVLSLLAPMLVIDRYRQQVPSLELGNELRVIEGWTRAAVSPASQTIISEGSDRDVLAGPSDSPVTVTTYSDMACPHCQVIAAVLHQLSGRYPIKLIFKDYPLDRHCNPQIHRVFHDFSCEAAKINRCALLTSQKLYSEVHQKIYELENVTTVTLQPLSDLVSSSSSAAAVCINEPGYPKSITRHLEEGSSLKIPGTPAVFINGKLVPQPLPNAIEKIIKLILESK